MGPNGGVSAKPIKAFVGPRAESVARQLAGGPESAPIRNGGPGGGPEMALERVFLAAFDGDGDGRITRAEFRDGFAGWSHSWDANHDGELNAAEIRAGLGKLWTNRI